VGVDEAALEVEVEAPVVDEVAALLKVEVDEAFLKDRAAEDEALVDVALKDEAAPEVEVGEEADEAALVDEAEREVGAAARERGKSEAGSKY